MESAVIIIGLLTLVAVAVLILVVVRERNKPPQPPDQGMVLLQQQMSAFQERLDKFGQTVAENLQSSLSESGSSYSYTGSATGLSRARAAAFQNQPPM